jgi:uncharacterized protein (DUF736 family)
MNIGKLVRNEQNVLVGRIQTTQVNLLIALMVVGSENPAAPVFRIMTLGAGNDWIEVGALFEKTANGTGEAFYNGKIDDPHLDNPLYISAFRQPDGSLNVVWSRPVRRAAAPTAPAMPAWPGTIDAGGEPAGDDAGGAGDGDAAGGTPPPPAGNANRRGRGRQGADALGASTTTD